MTRFLSIALLASAATLAAACTGAGDTAPADSHRGPLGKADAVGSCAQTDCDGQAPGGNCWCDEACSTYGDCCADHTAVCEAPVSQECGGFANLACGQGEYCHHDQAQSCGTPDQTGVCQPIPEVCTADLAPVCGCDGQTYGNACEANRAGASVLHDGACEQPAGTMCGGMVGFTCGAGQYCHFSDTASCGRADRTGTCEDLPDVCFEAVIPVCGCDGQTYTNSCFAARAGVSVDHDGGC